MRKTGLFSVLFLLIAFVGKAQGALPDMADKMRADGKIYVVVLVLATIFAGIILYLVRLDRKISKLEKQQS
ncbi:MAG: CcmD family protein [Mucilaginibacter sp.]